MVSRDVYHDLYPQVMRSGIVGFFSGLVHRMLERDFKRQDYHANVLELGATNGEHFSYVQHSYSKYIMSDIAFDSEKIQFLEKKFPYKSVKFQKVDASLLNSYKSSFFDRLVATCLILHLVNPQQALSEWRRVLKNDGYLSIVVPMEPGLLLGISQWFSTRRKFSKLGVDYYKWQYSEHINFAARVFILIDEVFKDDVVKYRDFPFHRLPWQLNLWRIYCIQIRKN